MVKLAHALLILAPLAFPSNANVSSGSANISITGSINAENSCNLQLSGGGVLDAGTHNISSLTSPTGGALSPMTEFTASIACIYPTNTAVKFSSSRPNSSGQPNKFGLIKTTKNNKEAAYIYTDTGTTSPQALNGSLQYAAIGNKQLNSSSLNTTPLEPMQNNTVIRSLHGNANNIITIIDSSGNPVSSTNFTYPFRVGVSYSQQDNDWKKDVQGETLSLDSTILLELYTF